MKSGAVTLTPLNYSINNWTGRDFSVIKCGNEADAFRGNGFLGLMREPGKLENIVHTGMMRLRLSDVVWNKNRLWVASFENGIFAYDLGGNPTNHINKTHGLPPADQGLKIAFHKGKMFASGAFGTELRSWIAEIVDFASKQPRVEVFHEAKKNSRAKERSQSISDDMAFEPRLFIPGPERPPYKNDVGQPSVFLITEISSKRRAFFINPLNREWEKEWTTANRDDTESHFAYMEGEIIQPRKIKRYRFNPKIERLSPLVLGREQVMGRERRPQGFVKVGEDVYLPGESSWLKLDLYNDEADVLTDSDKPIYLIGQLRFAPSAIYGIVGWRPGRRSEMFQLTIDSSAGTAPKVAIAEVVDHAPKANPPKSDGGIPQSLDPAEAERL
ncbi:MAG: hypothetical protein AAF497_25360, partial [Planctomycetota bacterium]